MPYTINGQAQQFADPIVADGSTYVPLAGIVETLGGYVTWDNFTKVAAIELGDKTARVQADSTSVEAAGQQMDLANAPYIENNSLWVPVDFFRSALGCQVSVNGDSVEVKSA